MLIRVTQAFPKEDDPLALEKSNQLERILLSDTFQRLEKPARLLTRLVNDGIASIIPEEHQLGIEIFERRKDWVTQDDAIVRQNLTRLRKLVESFYETEGVEDRLNLEISGYRTVFSYNPRHPFERLFRPALRHLATNPNVAFSLLDAALDIQPDHAEALAARAETELWRPMIGNEVDVADLLDAAEIQALQALRYDPDCWRAHVVIGAVRCCRREWEAADTSFKKAISSSPDRTNRHPWYAAFLMATGQTEEALELVRARASATSETSWPLLTYAIFLYAARRYDVAKRVIREAKARYEDTWLSHVVWCCISLAQGSKNAAVPLLGMSTPQSLPDGTVVYTAMALMEHLSRLDPEDADFAAAKIPIIQMTRQWLTAKETALATPSDEELSPFREIPVSPFHLAIAYMGLGEDEKAIDLVRLDAERGHPLMVWLHLWPLFDPLRRATSFKRVTKKLKTPKT